MRLELPSMVRTARSRIMRAGLAARATTVASNPARACSSRASAIARSRRRGQPGLADTSTDCSAIGMATMTTSTRTTPSVAAGRRARAGRKPRRTRRSARTPLPNKVARNCPRSSVIVRPPTSPALSSSVTTAPGTGRPLALSRTVPRSACAAASRAATVVANATRTAARTVDDARPMGTSPPRLTLTRSLGYPAARPAPDVDRLEPLFAPVDDEHAEPLLHPRLDVRRGGRVPARHVELLARGQHLLDARFPSLLVEDALAVRVGRREYSAKRPRAGEQDADALHRRDLAHAVEAGLGLDDGEVDELTVRVERPEVRLLLVLLLAHAPHRGRAADVVGSRAPLGLEAHRGEPALHFLGTLDADEHDATDAEVELLRDVRGGLGGVGGDLVHLDDERVMQPRRRSLRDHAARGDALREVRERGVAAIEVALHAAVEDVVGGRVA